jgi:hypothetical protein
VGILAAADVMIDPAGNLTPEGLALVLTLGLVVLWRVLWRR